MPVNGESDADWIEKPAARLARLEKAVASNTAQLAKGIVDQSNMERELSDLRRALEGVRRALEQMNSQELDELRKRADMPRRILLAVAVPVLIAVLTAMVLAGVTHVHFA